MFRRRITFPQMAMAMGLGTAGGVYIYGPYFRPPKPQQDQNPPETGGPSAGEKAPGHEGGAGSEPAGPSKPQNKV